MLYFIYFLTYRTVIKLTVVFFKAFQITRNVWRYQRDKSKKGRQYNGQKGQTMTHTTLHRKLKIEQHDPH
jgi:hypothetical protein